MRIAAIQHDIAWEDRDANFEHLAPLIAGAAAAGAGLALVSETFSTGFSMRPDLGEPEGGPSSRFLADQAKEHGIWVGGSCPEVPELSDPSGAPRTSGTSAGALPYNSFVLAGPGGEIHRYRKIHPFTYGGENTRFRAGDQLVTVEVAGLRISMFVCYDLRFADEFWQLAPQTDVYLVPANWPASRRLHWQALLQARAIENQAYVVGCNRVGSGGGLDYVGDSRIVSPLGELLATAAGTESILLADVSAATVAEVRDTFRFLPDRR